MLPSKWGQQPGESFEEWLSRRGAEQSADQAKRETIRKAAARGIRLCVLRSPVVRGLSSRECVRRRVCFQDGAPIPPKRQRWCSERCSDLYWRNHGWSVARQFATLRARVPDLALDVAWSEAVKLFRLPERCSRCGKETGSIEVNHREPRNGEGYEEGCAHHQANLEPLCHECHVAETTRQIRARRGIPEDGWPARPSGPPGEPPLPLWGET